MRASSIIVETYLVTSAPLRLPPRGPRHAQNSIINRAASAFTAMCVHVAVIGALLTVQPREPIQPDRVAGVRAPQDGYSIEPVTFVALDETADSDAPWPEPPALPALPIRGLMHLSVSDLDLTSAEVGELEATEDTARTTVPVAAEGDDRAELFARYLEQIKARIERARQSIDPLTGTADATCEAHIQQDSTGAVLEVELVHCSGEAARRDVLISAVLRASPLPAPPVSQVFAERVVIFFARH